jgi:hypothetical protein
VIVAYLIYIYINSSSLLETEGSLPYSQKPSMDRILSQLNPIHILTPYFFKIYFSIILPSTLRSRKPAVPFRISDQNVMYLSHNPMLSTCLELYPSRSGVLKLFSWLPPCVI